ncbi:MAG: hypothetical protein E7019_00935 [Alphaproteobacteria bacterium]|nr:hypothetical protein [Alphaproteobacteria bacterium]
MEGYITISSADLMYFSGFMVCSLLLLLLFFCFVWYLYAKIKKRKEQKEIEEAQRDWGFVESLDDMALKALYGAVLRGNLSSTTFRKVVEKEARRRGIH